MKLTPIQRRERISALVREDDECRKLFDEYTSAKERFIRFTDRLPRPVRELLWRYPGTGYFLHHRILTIVCENMRFEDEACEP